MFYRWTNALSPDVQVCPVQLPGRESRLDEPAFNRVGPLVKELTLALEAYLDVPCAFLGNSMGALVCFELARELRRLGGGPRWIFVAASMAPQLRSRSKAMHELPEAEFIQEMNGRYNGIPAVVLESPELMRLFLPVLRADLAVLETYEYEPEPPLECGISVFGGLDDGEVSREELSAWSQQTRGPFRLRMFEGDHFFLNGRREQVLRAVAEDLGTDLRKT
jgi:medium-chain acyl-[acyl-carrier-protein] hydrolase